MLSSRVIVTRTLLTINRARLLETKLTPLSWSVQVDDPGYSRYQEELANQHFGQSETLARIFCRDGLP